MRARGVSLLWLFCAISLYGCDNPESPPVLTKVFGTVSYLDRPLQGGTIVFIPDEERGTTGALVHADIQLNGTYSLRTGTQEGIAPGAYRVTVRPASALPGRARQDWPQPPERYSDPRTSGLSCKVQNVEAHTINFHLQ
jgi:hypothetical protein